MKIFTMEAKKIGAYIPLPTASTRGSFVSTCLYCLGVTILGLGFFSSATNIAI